MKTTEFRIGNFIHWDIPEKVGVTHEIVVIKEHRINTIPISLGESMDDYLPITLTKEWLLKFGFTESNQLFVYKGDNFQVFIYPNISDDYFHFSANQWLIVNIWYVHQLQNLIYTLFGVELQLSST